MLKLNYNSFKCLGKQKNIINICFCVILLYGLIIGMVSCATIQGGKGSQPRSSRLSCNIPPVILQEKIKTVLEEPPLNLNVISAYEGRIETEFEERPGEFRGILWARKRNQERIKYIITIKPRWNNTESSEVSIYAKIDYRLNDHFEWEPKKSADNKNRILEIFRSIDRIDK